MVEAKVDLLKAREIPSDQPIITNPCTKRVASKGSSLLVMPVRVLTDSCVARSVYLYICVCVCVCVRVGGHKKLIRKKQGVCAILQHYMWTLFGINPSLESTWLPGNK